MELTKHGAVQRDRRCDAPDLNQYVAEYCFGEISQHQRHLFEAHLLDCDFCWMEVRRLSSAMEGFRADRELIPMFLPADVSACLGISAKLVRGFGGHVTHAIVAAVLYGLVYVCGLFSEVAYAFDQFGRTALELSPLVFAWVVGTSFLALWLDWKWVIRGVKNGLGLSLAILAVSALLLYAGLCSFLPARPITQMNIQAYTAQAAYMKGIRYILPLAAVYLIVPFHFVLVMQSELREQRFRLALGLISGERWAVAPKNAFYIGIRTLWIVLLALIVISVPMTSHLFDNLKPGVYLNLFTHLMQLRWALYFGFAIECLMWYSGALNELKRECLLSIGGPTP